MDAVLFRMHNGPHELVCSVEKGIVRLAVDGQRCGPGVQLLPLTTLDEVVDMWPKWLRKSGWRLVDPEVA